MRDPRRRPKPNDTTVVEVPLGLIKECDFFRLRQPPYPNIEELAADIERNGQTTPLFLLPQRDGLHPLFAGCRRLHALRLLGATTALARIFDITDEAAYDIAVSENQHRDALSELERADVCLKLHGRGTDNKEIAKMMGWTNDRSVRRYLQLAREATAPLREKLQNRDISFNAAMVFINHGVHLPEDVQEKILAGVSLQSTSADELQKTLLAFDQDQPKRTAKEKEPIKTLKNGGFVVRTVRLDADHPSGIERGIDLLRSALRKARRLKKRVDAVRGDSDVTALPEASE